MDIQISYIVAPCLGGLISYISNDIAIRMLFLPHKAKYIMEWQQTHLGNVSTCFSIHTKNFLESYVMFL